MRKITMISSAAVLLLIACNNKGSNENENKDTTAKTQTEIKTDSPTAPPDPAAFEKAMVDFSTPGNMHKWMANFRGTWEATVIGYMDPAKPDSSKATKSISMALNGLYQLGKFTGYMMGRPFEGHSTLAYDNAKKLFINTWIDNLGSGIIIMTGTYDEATKTLNLKGLQTDPMTGKETDIREELTTIDNDSYTMILFGEGMDGKEMKFMEGLFKRKK